MAEPWEPEHPVDRELAASLAADQLPELAGQPLHRVGHGWDNDVWRIGAQVLRFPRRAMGVELLAVEARVLPALAPRLSVPVPCPTFVGRPSPAFPAAFVVHPWLPGTTADRARLTADERLALAPAIGRFLAELHALPVAEAATLGVPDDTFRADADRIEAQVDERLDDLRGSEPDDVLDAARRLLADRPPPGIDLVVVHGDLYARHLLIGDDRRLCGVIDWGDCCVGDRALDLGLAFTLLPPEARAAFFDAYGEVRPDHLRRARWFALHKAVALVRYGGAVGDAPLLAEGRVALGHVLAD